MDLCFEQFNLVYGEIDVADAKDKATNTKTIFILEINKKRISLIPSKIQYKFGKTIN